MKKFTAVVIVLLVLLSVVSLVACEKKPPSYCLITESNSYKVGDSFNGETYIQVTTGDKIERVDISSDMLSGFSTDKVVGMATATVTYGDFSADFNYFVSLAPQSLSSDNETLYVDQKYGEKEIHVFDMLLPCPLKELKGDEKVMLYVHGGSWMSGSKKENFGSVLPAIVNKNYIVFTMNYTLASSKHPVKVAYSDIGAMIAYLKDFLPTIGINTSKIALGGYSAGAHLTAWYAYSTTELSPMKISFLLDMVGPVDVSDEGYQAAVNEVKTNNPGLINLFAPIVKGVIGYDKEVDFVNDDLTELWAYVGTLSGMPYINENSCPTIMVYAGGDGTKGLFPADVQNDSMVPLSCYTNLKAKLDEKGVSNVGKVFEGETHSTLGWDEEVLSWLAERMAEYGEAYL